MFEPSQLAVCQQSFSTTFALWDRYLTFNWYIIYNKKTPPPPPPPPATTTTTTTTTSNNNNNNTSKLQTPNFPKKRQPHPATVIRTIHLCDAIQGVWWGMGMDQIHQNVDSKTSRKWPNFLQKMLPKKGRRSGYQFGFFARMAYQVDTKR